MPTEAIIIGLAGVLAAAAPVMFAVMGETLTERAGLINLSMNGTILLSAMSSFAIAVSTEVETTPSLDDLIAHYKAIPKGQLSISDQYAYSIALIAHDNHQQALELLQQLIQRKDHPWFKLALADAYEHSNQARLAMETLENLNQLYPNYLPVCIAYATLLNSHGNYERSLQLLKRILQYQKHPVIYETLAQTYYSKGQIGAALEATSYQYEQEGYLKLAAQQIDNAMKQPDLDTSARQRLESRKAELIEQLKREKMN